MIKKSSSKAYYSHLITFSSSAEPKRYSCNACGISGRFHFEDPHEIISAIMARSKYDNQPVELMDLYRTLVEQSDLKQSPLYVDLGKHFSDAVRTRQELNAAITLSEAVETTNRAKYILAQKPKSERDVILHVVNMIQTEMKRLGKDLNRLNKLGLVTPPEFH